MLFHFLGDWKVSRDRGLLDLDELVPGDKPVIVEVDPPEGQLYPVQLVRID